MIILFTVVSSQGPNDVPIQGFFNTTITQAITAWILTIFCVFTESFKFETSK